MPPPRKVALLNFVRGDNRGLTLLELLIGASISVGTVFLVGRIMIGSTAAVSRVIGRSQVASDIGAMAGLIGRVGRVAQSCQKPAPSTLQCNVDFNSPPTGSLTAVKFTVVAMPDGTQDLVYQKQVLSQWVTQIAAQNITQFTVCNDVDMRTGASACPIEPQAFNVRYADPSQGYGETPLPNRFFRFAISGKVNQPGSNSTPPVVIQTQSAFYLRNPGEYGVAYQWAHSASGGSP